MLRGQVALVTGASRGIGRGIALQLGEAGAIVYVSGRQPSKSDQAKATELPTLEKTAQEITGRGGKGIAAYCDHANDDEVKALFERIDTEQNGRLDILVNNAYAAVNAITTNTGKKFYEQDIEMWDTVNRVGLRNHYICSVYAARMMVKRQQGGLIVVVSSAGGLRYLFNIAYGVGKAACDRLAQDMAVELDKHKITVISLWPGAVKTELIEKNVLSKPKDNMGANELAMRSVFEDGESTEYSGMVLKHFASDPNRHSKTGKVWISGDLGAEYGLKDIDGRVIGSMRQIRTLMQLSGHTWLAAVMPAWLRIPGWMLSAINSKL